MASFFTLSIGINEYSSLGKIQNSIDMKNQILKILALFLFMITFTGCSVIGDIFEAGLWVGVIIVVLIIVFVFWIIKKLL
ncbi:hypothetical protein [Aquiflexum lacus]|uniref:hypothetical protein n=1 Tax=Aquiflexum lacus TaxID=2483805 RepID=UPI0018936AD9|nr:hypothetical protein [Aquiflexum lacus]